MKKLIQIRKSCVLFAVLFVISLCLGSCSEAKYSEEDVIGLTSAEIVEKYGDFDRAQGSPDANGLYRDCACGYLITAERKGFLGTTPPKYFMIYFDGDGVANWCRYEEVV